MTLKVTKAKKNLTGEITVPGDKSISHRAIMLGTLARGTTEIYGLLQGEDCLSTVRCCRSLGAVITIDGERTTVTGCAGELKEPETVLDAGNSGTTARLLMGIIAAQPGLYAVLCGDSSLSRRPMERITKPLEAMGGQLLSRGGRLPVTVSGRKLEGITYHSPVASAQVKSAVLLAGLAAQGETVVVEPVRSRDHTERMLGAFGAKVEQDTNTAAVRGGQVLSGREVIVPGDISSAAFFLAAAAVVPGSILTITNVGINSTRSGFLDALMAMGAGIRLKHQRSSSGEEVADIEIKAQPLKGALFGGSLIPRMIDEIPALAVAALACEGKTVIRDAAELRVKESDRIGVLARELSKMGARISERADGLEITGGRRLTGAVVSSHGDHRIAMALAVAGLIAEGETVVDGSESIDISFPGFARLLGDLSALSSATDTTAGVEGVDVCRETSR